MDSPPFIRLIRRVNILSSEYYNFLFSFSPSQFFFLLPHVKPCLMPIGLNSNLENKIPGPTVAMFFCV